MFLGPDHKFCSTPSSKKVFPPPYAWTFKKKNFHIKCHVLEIIRYVASFMSLSNSLTFEIRVSSNDKYSKV